MLQVAKKFGRAQQDTGLVLLPLLLAATFMLVRKTAAFTALILLREQNNGAMPQKIM